MAPSPFWTRPPETRHPGFELAMVSLVEAATILPLMLSAAFVVGLSRDLRFGVAGLGALAAIFFGSAALASPVLGRFTERLGPELVVKLSGTVAAIALIGAAVTATTWAALAACTAVGGISSGGSRPAGNAWVAARLPPRRHGFATGVKATSAPVASMTAGLLAVSWGVGNWRAGYVTAALLAAVITYLSPRVRQPAKIARTETTEPVRATSLGRLAPLCIVAAIANTAGASVTVFAVPALIASGASAPTAAIVFTASSGLGLAARVVFGSLVDRRGLSPVRVLRVLYLSGAVAFAACASHVLGVVIIAVPATFVTAWAWFGIFNMAVIRLNPSQPAAATGWTQAAAFAGGVVGPLVTGSIAELASVSAGQVFLASAMAVAGLATLADSMR